jgi:hypothetical protein
MSTTLQLQHYNCNFVEYQFYSIASCYAIFYSHNFFSQKLSELKSESSRADTNIRNSNNNYDNSNNDNNSNNFENGLENLRQRLNGLENKLLFKDSETAEVKSKMNLVQTKINQQESKISLLEYKLASKDVEVREIKMKLENEILIRNAKMFDIQSNLSNFSIELKLLSKFSDSELKQFRQKINETVLRLQVIEDFVSKLGNSTSVKSRNVSVSELGTSTPETGHLTGNLSSRSDVELSVNDQLLRDLFNEVNNVRTETSSKVESLSSKVEILDAKVENCSKDVRQNFDEESTKTDLEEMRQDLKKLSIISKISSKSEFALKIKSIKSDITFPDYH